MSAFGAVVVYVIVWWLVFFMALPFGVRRHEEPEPGLEAGAPASPRLGLKALITTVVAAALTYGIHLIVAQGWIDFRPA